MTLIYILPVGRLSMGRRFRRKDEERVIARRRIARLFELAHRRTIEDEPALAERAVRLARRIGMRYQTGLRPDERDRVCRSCNAYLAPGNTARIRVEAGVKKTTCLRCGATRRRPYRAEQKARRRQAASGPGDGRGAPQGPVQEEKGT